KSICFPLQHMLFLDGAYSFSKRGASGASIQQGLRCTVNWPREWFGCGSGGAPLRAAGAAFSGLCDQDDGSSGVAWAKTGVRLQPQILA
ncbi:MAG: hypothetical protein V3S21_03020, partial [Xanthomonadales bacterium]